MGEEDVIYKLVREDVEEVARAQNVELTEDEMLRVKKGVESGFGNCWWDIVKSAIDDILYERKQGNERSETGD